MIRRLAALCATLVGCADPVIELSLKMPGADQGADFDTSCVTAIEVVVFGNDYPDQPSEYTRDCHEVTSPAANFNDIRKEMLGEFDLRIPPSGIASIEVFGRLGNCDPLPPDGYPPDMLFYGGAEYHGGESVTIQLEGRLSCAAQPMTVHPLDILKLAATPADCAGAVLPSTNTSYVDVGAISNTLHGPQWFGGDVTFAQIGTDGLANLPAARLTTTKDACPSIAAYSEPLDGATCIINNPRLCGGPTHVEVPTIPYTVSDTLINPELAMKWDNVIIGTVWVSGAAKAAVQGATVELDSALGEVEYVEPGATVTRSSTSTGPSGLFVLYTNTMNDVTVRGAGTSRVVRLAGAMGGVTTSLVVLK